MRILVLDLHKRRRQLLESVLAGQGHEVTVVGSVSELIAERRSKGHQLVFIAAETVHHEGLPLSQQLRLPGEEGRCVVLAIEDEGTADVHDLLAAGVDDVLAGPLDSSGILLRTSIAEHRLRRGLRRERWFETLVALGTTVYTVTDARGIVVYTSPSLTNVSGFDPATLIGRSFVDLVVPDDRETARRLLAEAVSRPGEMPRARLRCRNEDGAEYIFEASVRNCLDDSLIGGLIITSTDVTKLRESEERYRLIAENVSDVIWTRQLPEPIEVIELRDYDAAEGFTRSVLDRMKGSYVSPSITHLLGYSVAEALSLPIQQVLTERSYSELLQSIATALLHRAEGRRGAVTQELEYRTKSGGTCWVEITGSFLWDERGRVAGSLTVGRDVAQRKEMEEALLDSEHRLRRLIENMPDFVILVDENAEIDYVNRGVKDLKASELIGRSGFGFLTEECRPACRRAFVAALKTGEVQYLEAQDIFGSWWSCRLVPLKETTVATHVMIICTDMTEHRQAREAVQKEQDLLRQMIELQERDRKVLAFELHDGFAQQLTGAMMSIEVAARLMACRPEEAKASLTEAARLLRESIEESRRLVSGLCPPVLEQFGIVPALEHLASLNHCDGQLEIEFVLRGRIKRLAAPLENAIFRVVQESLTNIRRHSRSRKALVELRLQDEEVCIEVRDWGIGFQPDGVRETCFGLRGIRERARLFGGKAEILSAPLEGSRVRVSLPMIEPPCRDGARLESR